MKKGKRFVGVDRDSVWNSLPPAIGNDETMRLLREYCDENSLNYGSQEVKKKIIEGNLRFVRYFVSTMLRDVVCCQSNFYPSLEDLYQEGCFVLMKAVDRFNLDYKFQFSSYVSKSITRVLRRLHNSNITRLNYKSISLDEKISADDDNLYLRDLIGDDFKMVINSDDSMTAEEVRKILAILPKEERDIFVYKFVKHKPLSWLAEKYDVTRSMVDLSLTQILDKVKMYYHFGMSDTDKLMRGVKTTIYSKKRIAKNSAILKKYGRNFLENYFCLKLTPDQRLVFKDIYLNYYGQSIIGTAEKLGFTQTHMNIVINAIDRKIVNKIDQYFEQFNNNVEARFKQRKDTQLKINRNKKLVEDYGGEMFLRRYFIPTLSDIEKRLFEECVLNYYGLSQGVIAKRVGIDQKVLAIREKMVLEKLKNTNFDVLVDMVDRTEHRGIDFGKQHSRDLDKVFERAKIVEKFGGEDKLRKYFLPILSDVQQKVFKDLFLNPVFTTVTAMANESDISLARIVREEKIILEKLKTTNLDELIQIQKECKHYCRAEITLQSARKNSKRKKTEWLEKNGGEEFLREKFVPLLLPADQIIFEKYIVERKTSKEVCKILKIKNEYYITNMFHDRIMPKLKSFKESFENYDEEVKSFYSQKQFEKLHSEDFEKLAFGEAEKEEKKPAEDEKKENASKRAISEEQIKAWGGKIWIVRKYMPCFESATEQFFLFYAIGRNMTDQEIMDQLELNKTEYKTLKQKVLEKLQKKSETSKKSKDYSEKKKNN